MGPNLKFGGWFVSIAALLIASPLIGKPKVKEPPPPVQEAPKICETQKWCYSDRLIEAKVGYFFFADSKMSDIYPNGGIDVQLSSSYPIWKWLQIYASVEYYEKNGETKNTGYSARIQALPISLGLRSLFWISNTTQYYLGIGPRYLFAWSHNSSPYLVKNLDQNGIGGFVNTGFNFFPLPESNFVIDLFAEYSYVQLDFHTERTNIYGESAQLGGLTFGLGLGYGF